MVLTGGSKMLEFLQSLIVDSLKDVDEKKAKEFDPLLYYTLVIEKDELKVTSRHHGISLFSLFKRGENNFFCSSTSFIHVNFSCKVSSAEEVIDFFDLLELPGWPKLKDHPRFVSSETFRTKRQSNF